jgi:hypothetical protein
MFAQGISRPSPEEHPDAPAHPAAPAVSCSGRLFPPYRSGMLGVTAFGIFLTPVFFYVLQ